MTPAGEFRDAGAAARWARNLLYAQAALAAISAATVLSGGFDTFVLSNAELVVEILQNLLYFACGVTVLRWLYLANANARSLGAHDMMVTPVMAVIWPFVPLANLFMPYLTVRELWKASARPRDFQAVTAPAILPLWWAVWIASAVSGVIAATSGFGVDKELLDAAATTRLVHDAFVIAGTLLFARILGRIQEMQTSPEHLRDRFA